MDRFDPVPDIAVGYHSPGDGVVRDDETGTLLPMATSGTTNRPSR